MSFVKSSGFKYLKNLIIGVGAAIVMMGALFKILSLEGGNEMLTAGLVTEAILFLLLGIIPPEKDYYWDKLYPGLGDYNTSIAPLTAGPSDVKGPKALDGEIVQNQLGGMLAELQAMSKSLGSLKALQEIDFSKTGEQLKTMGNFYQKLNQAMSDMASSSDEAIKYKDAITALNKNLNSLNNVYGNVLTAMTGGQRQA